MNSIYYTSLTGMMAASFGLQNTSNNVSNIQSPGFKRSDVFYSSLGYDEQFGGLGSGVTIGGKAINFSEGKYLPTNNATDLAIIGQGFFIVRLKNGEFLYTRDGEFVFNESGILIDRHSGGIVQGYNSAGHLTPIYAKGPETAVGKITHHVYLKGKWVIEKQDSSEKGDNDPTPPDPSDSMEDKNQYKNIKFDVTSIYDKQGNAHQVTLEFKASEYPADGTEWTLISATCNDAEIYFEPEQLIRFSSKDDGNAQEEYSSLRFTLNGSQTINVHLGTYMSGADSSVITKDKTMVNVPDADTIEVNEQDGYGAGQQIDFFFDDNGQITYQYDNGEKLEGIYIALARFDETETTLMQTRDNLFKAKNNKGLHIDRPNKKGLGSIQQKQLETSNVDPTNEFANIVVLQRMFQACSQIMDIDKQLIEELSGRK
ncbi:flagellar hook-basal body complex protein [Legionella israelensis]|uniref:Flagellar hook protein FlgE n=1 Tax=Legionella israelensis TaxID=454 RepID=A0A0W0W3G1_9GAMM|nr:flagellar hook-basal body complex protein [Legionella israelensis]KTD26825.1 flagellar hook protein FlgE [Legionella israelensis]QBS10866.1 flagellar hook-basal body complex protein [Legionella israelensis]SCY47434.1 flagellar hook protein FlgE [Legionella israelensis DSM 19235]STX57850.1 flagellar hook protein FlgE [Legionella israelensis]